MELRVLRYFLAVAREQSISKAAEAVHVTQPTLSRQIMDLEDELGARLFVRSKHNRSVLLTEAGQRLYDYARKIIELSDKTIFVITVDGEETRAPEINGMQTYGNLYNLHTIFTFTQPHSFQIQLL